MSRWMPSCLLLATLAALGCTPTPSLEDLSRVAALEDRRVDDPQAWAPWLTHRDPRLRGLAARGMGRVRAGSLVAPLLERLGTEDDSRAAGEMIFALGQIADPRATDPLLELEKRTTAALRARILEALGKIGMQRSALFIERLEDPAPAVRRAALAALVRLHGRRADPPAPLEATAAATLLEALSKLRQDTDAELRWWAVYTLEQISLPGATNLLLDACADPDDRARIFAVRGLGRRLEAEPAIAERVSRALSPLLDDASPHVAAAAATVLGRMPDKEVRKALAQAFVRHRNSKSFHLRLAIVSLPQLPPGVLARALADGSRMVRAKALERGAGLRDPGTPEVARWAISPDRWQRAAAARAAARLELPAALRLLDRLRNDADPLVAAQAIEALDEQKFDRVGDQRRRWLLEALEKNDLALRGTALSLLARHGKAEDLAAVRACFAAATGDADVEVRREALRTAKALAGARAHDFFVTAAADPSPAVAALARELGGLPAATGERIGKPSSVRLVAGEDFGSERENPRALLETSRGRIVIELLREQAPRHVKNFTTLARRGFYDGLPFHRVVSGFVIQGLDPRGDGWGTGGVFLRDEINPLPYERGTVGMPNAGPDTGGCQIFITHVPTPHLDGRYTVFGRVVEGMDVVDAIEVGDTCISVEIR
ncbi:MAG: peptidylprolyl isomerase [Acidobacteriota bacterium]|nr:peptidylprolyl isomerase [Acidobacteriota bacterium]